MNRRLLLAPLLATAALAALGFGAVIAAPVDYKLPEETAAFKPGPNLDVVKNNCTACHLPSLRGKSENPSAIGPDLTDTRWIHGGVPREIYQTVAHGVLAKGMPAWEPVLGQKKSAELIA